MAEFAGKAKADCGGKIWWTAYAGERNSKTGSLVGAMPSVSTRAAPAAVRAHHVRIAHAASVANVIEVLQDLDCTLAAQPDRIAIASGIYGTALLRERAHDIGEFTDAFAVVEEIMHDLIHGALRDQLA